MTRKHLVVLAVAAVAVVALPGGRAVGQGPVMIAAPGSYLTPTFGQPGVVVQAGGELTFVNLDAYRHDLVAVQKAGQYAPVQCSSPTSCPEEAPPWCTGFPAGFCPIIWSLQIGLGRTTPVLGLQYLTTGQVIEFFCTLHPAMRGYLVAA